MCPSSVLTGRASRGFENEVEDKILPFRLRHFVCDGCAGQLPRPHRNPASRSEGRTRSAGYPFSYLHINVNRHKNIKIKPVQFMSFFLILALIKMNPLSPTGLTIFTKKYFKRQ